MQVNTSRRICGLLPLYRAALRVERIGISPQQVFHRRGRSWFQSIFWRVSKHMPISGGMVFKELFDYRELLHSERHLSTDNRDLSTISLSGQDVAVPAIPLNVATFIQKEDLIHGRGLQFTHNRLRMIDEQVPERAKRCQLFAHIPDQQGTAPEPAVVCLHAKGIHSQGITQE